MKKLAVFASGSGSNYEAIAAACADGRIDAEVVLLVCDNPGAYVLRRAEKFGTPTLVFNPRDYESKAAIKRVQSNACINFAEREQSRAKLKAAIKRVQSNACINFAEREQSRAKLKAEFERPIADQMDALGVDLVCLAGYMRIVGDVLLKRYGGRIINIHPSLLPAFKGAHAVERAVEYGVKVYGITIHWVDETLDGGRIIAQRSFDYDGNDPLEVHRLGQVIEHQLYIETINKLLAK